jgi:hypothetical protein
MASSRRRGSNPTIRTFGSLGSGRNYDSLSTWEAFTDNDLVTGAISEDLECYTDASPYNQRITLFGGTVNSTFFRSIVAAAGQKHNGVIGVGVWFTCTSDADNTFHLSEGPCSLHDIGVTYTLNGTTIRYAIEVSGTGAAGKRVTNCIVANCTNAGTADDRGMSTRESTDVVVNTLVYNSGIGFDTPVTATFNLYNCNAIDNSSIGFNVASGSTYVMKNCLASGNGTNYGGAGATTGSTNNAGSSGTPPGSNPQTGTFVFVNAGAGNYHLSASDTVAKNNGTSLAADATFAFDDDVDGQTITTWSIGFDSNISAGVAKSAHRYYRMTS